MRAGENKNIVGPKVSIITICYNEKSDIINTCNSVVSQMYKNYEWIVVDGGSTDGTLEILQEYSFHIDKLVSEKDKGVYDAMNKGIELATGEYVLFLNGGDFLFANDVLDNVFVDSKYTGEILYGNCCVLHKDRSKVILEYPERFNKFYFLDNCINHQSTFIKKSLFDKYSLYDLTYKILADYEKWLCFIENKVVYQKIPFVISNFKWFDGLSSQEKTKNLTNEEKEKIIKKYFRSYELFFWKIRNLIILFMSHI